MPIYHSLGKIPRKRHCQFRKEDGSLFREELMGSMGFAGLYSLLYHHNLPPRAKRFEEIAALSCAEVDEPLRHHHLRTKEVSYGGDPVTARKILMFNSDVSICVSLPTEKMNYFYRNAGGDEIHFVHEGEGELQSIFGAMAYREGDYIVIPRGATYKLAPSTSKSRFLVIESAGQIEIPSRYRNEFGQLLEHSPYCERDIRRPERLDTFVQEGDFEVRIKSKGKITVYHYAHHPFDVVGWDGCLYPWCLNIGDFEPITGRIHQPPPVHQTFQGQNFVVCSFVPRLFDYHPEAIPIPYYHSNVNCDEVLYYVKGEFMSRKGVEYASFTIHPAGIPHGPQPGLIEKSLGAKATNELAVMIDTFRPLKLTAEALKFDDPAYPYSWL